MRVEGRAGRRVHDHAPLRLRRRAAHPQGPRSRTPLYQLLSAQLKPPLCVPVSTLKLSPPNKYTLLRCAQVKLLERGYWFK